VKRKKNGSEVCLSNSSAQKFADQKLTKPRLCVTHGIAGQKLFRRCSVLFNIFYCGFAIWMIRLQQ
jgi:hypothetical protein